LSFKIATRLLIYHFLSTFLTLYSFWHFFEHFSPLSKRGVWEESGKSLGKGWEKAVRILYCTNPTPRSRTNTDPHTIMHTAPVFASAFVLALTLVLCGVHPASVLAQQSTSQHSIPQQNAPQLSTTATYHRIFFRDKGAEHAPTGTLAALRSTDTIPLQTSLYAATRAIHTDRSMARRRKNAGTFNTQTWDAQPNERLFAIADAPVWKPYLDSIATQGARLIVPVRWQNYVVVDCSPETALRLASLPFVRAVQRTSRKLYPQTLSFISSDQPLATATATEILETAEITETAEAASSAASETPLRHGVGLPQAESIVATPLHAMGITGKGVVVGFMDSGFRWKQHPALRSANVLAEWDVIFADSSTANQSLDSSTQDQHGTEIFSIVAGMDNGVFTGIAPDAAFLLAKTEDIRAERHIEEDNFAAAIEWMEAQGADIINASLGYTTFDTPDEHYVFSDLDGKTPIATRAVNAAVARGVLHCNAAGNDGPNPRTLSVPADADGAFAVAAARSDSVRLPARFSSRGPRADGITKPDIAARGDSVTVATALGGYRLVRGTSAASPMIAGAAALMLSAFPERTAQQIRAALQATALQATTQASAQATAQASAQASTNNATGAGTANALAAMLADVSGSNTINNTINDAIIITPELAQYPVLGALRVAAFVRVADEVLAASAVSASLFVRFASASGFREFPMQQTQSSATGAGAQAGAQAGAGAGTGAGTGIVPALPANAVTSATTTTFTMFTADLDNALFGDMLSAPTSSNAARNQAEAYLVVRMKSRTGGSAGGQRIIERRMPTPTPWRRSLASPALAALPIAATHEPTLTLTPLASQIPSRIRASDLPISLPTADHREGVRPSPVAASSEGATLTIITPEAALALVSVYSLTGQEVFSQAIAVGTGVSNIAIPTRLLSRGMYVARVRYDAGSTAAGAASRTSTTSAASAARSFPFIVN
jgi:hypothetical protein